MKAGKADLKGTKYDWLSNPKNMTRRQKQRFKALRDSTLKTARAWAIKELAMSLWGYVSKTWARKGWARWLSWAVRCRLEPIKRVFDLVKDFGTSESPKSTRSSTTHWCPGRPGHPAFRHNIASSLRLHTGLPYDWTPRSDAPLGSPLAPSARRVSRVASRLPGTTRLRFALHGGQRKKVAKTIKKHLWGILNAIVLKVSNGPAEGINSRIKAIKVRSHGFRNKERFANAIYFHLDGLDLYPEAISQQLLPT